MNVKSPVAFLTLLPLLPNLTPSFLMLLVLLHLLFRSMRLLVMIKRGRTRAALAPSQEGA